MDRTYRVIWKENEPVIEIGTPVKYGRQRRWKFPSENRTQGKGHETLDDALGGAVVAIARLAGTWRHKALNPWHAAILIAKIVRLRNKLIRHHLIGVNGTNGKHRNGKVGVA